MNHNYIPLISSSRIPKYAVVGGYDCDRSPIYVGRVSHEGHELLANVIHSKNSANVCWDGCAVIKTEYEVLTGENYRWYECCVGTVPRTAILAGRKPNGQPLYIGRGHIDGSLVVGTVDPSNKMLHIPFDGEECEVECCEILTYQTPHIWVQASLRNIPKDAVIGGYESKNSNHIYVGRAWHDGEILPAKISPVTGGAYVSLAGEDIFTSQYQFLTGDDYRWVDGQYYEDLPLGAVSTGRTRDGEFVYVGRGKHNGSLCVGKIYPFQYCVFIPYGGKEIKVKDYEVLVRIK